MIHVGGEDDVLILQDGVGPLEDAHGVGRRAAGGAPLQFDGPGPLRHVLREKDGRLAGRAELGPGLGELRGDCRLGDFQDQQPSSLGGAAVPTGRRLHLRSHRPDEPGRVGAVGHQHERCRTIAREAANHRLHRGGIAASGHRRRPDDDLAPGRDGGQRHGVGRTGNHDDRPSSGRGRPAEPAEGIGRERETQRRPAHHRELHPRPVHRRGRQEERVALLPAAVGPTGTKPRLAELRGDERRGQVKPPAGCVPPEHGVVRDGVDTLPEVIDGYRRGGSTDRRGGRVIAAGCGRLGRGNRGGRQKGDEESEAGKQRSHQENPVWGERSRRIPRLAPQSTRIATGSAKADSGVAAAVGEAGGDAGLGYRWALAFRLASSDRLWAAHGGWCPARRRRIQGTLTTVRSAGRQRGPDDREEEELGSHACQPIASIVPMQTCWATHCVSRV